MVAVEDAREADKRKLGIDDQIAKLKSRGVAFELCSEEEAASYLADRTYFFKLYAYRTLFEKRVDGPRDGQYSATSSFSLRLTALCATRCFL